MLKRIFLGFIFVGCVAFASVQNVANISDLKEAIVLLLERQEQIDKKVAENIKKQEEFIATASGVMEFLDAVDKKIDEIEGKLKTIEGSPKVDDLRKETEKISDELANEMQLLQDNVKALKDQVSVYSSNQKEEKEEAVFDKKTAEMMFMEIFNDKETYSKFEALFNKLFDIKAKENAFGVINQTVIRLDDNAGIKDAVTTKKITKKITKKRTKDNQIADNTQKTEDTKSSAENTNQDNILSNNDKEKSSPRLSDEQFSVLQDLVKEIAKNTTKEIYAEIQANTKKLSQEEEKNTDMNVLPISKSKWAKGIVDELNNLKLEISRFKDIAPEHLQWLDYKLLVLEKNLKKCCSSKNGEKEEEILFEYELK